MPRIAAIVVTFNRVALLQECVQAVRSQTRRPDEIIVVDNSSTDGTREWLDVQPDLTVVRQENLGSSGGQQTGIKTAFQKGHDWFWCMDDDTIPCSDALEQMMAAPYFQAADTGCLSSLVLGRDGKIFGSDYLQPAASANWALSVLHDQCIRVRIATFVSLLVRREAVEKMGLPIKELFLMRDDWEFTDRIARQFKNYCVLTSRVIHKVPPASSSDKWYNSNKQLYCARNQIAWIRNKDLTPLQKGRDITAAFITVAWMIVRGRMPLRSMVWFFEGLVMRLPIEFPTSTQIDAKSAEACSTISD
ncbi:MAG: dTDP-rhamnosyl transferase rfbF [Pirellula sp.]|nr:dTDP-rhamnosyl transferase rfbF [Pirellula sp.]